MFGSFRELVSSQAYQEQATARAKANIFAATGVAASVMILQNIGLGLWWLLIFPALWFIASIMFALPFMLIVVWVASLRIKLALSGNSTTFTRNFLTGVQYTIDALNYVVVGIATYYGLHWLAGR